MNSVRRDHDIMNCEQIRIWLEGGGRGSFNGTILVLAWTEWDTTNLPTT
jgi:hypothetical protein